MARIAHLISIHAGRVEGVAIDGGDLLPETAHIYRSEQPTANISAEGHSTLAAFLEETGWTQRGALIILDTKLVRLRRLEFPFQAPKRIRQIIAPELDNVLLGPLEELEYDFRTIPKEDESAEVVAFLVRRDLLDGVLAECQRHGIQPLGVTFAAEVLNRALPDMPEHGFLVYVGDDELFAVHCSAGGLRAIRTIPGEMTARLAPLVNGQAVTTMTAVQEGSAARAMQPEQQALDPATVLAPVVGAFNLFIRTHAVGENSPAVVIRGRLAPQFQWNPAEMGLEIVPGKLEQHGHKRPTGLLGEFDGNVKDLLSARGINFARRRFGWLNQLRQVRRPLIALATLSIMALVLGSVLLGLNIQQQRTRLAQLEQQTEAIVRRHVPRFTTLQAGLQVLRDRVAQQQQGRALNELFTDYHYNMLNLLQTLSAVYGELPGLTMESLQLNNERLILTGRTESYQQGEELRNRLTALPRFEGREITITNQRSPDGIAYRVAIQGGSR